MARSLPVAAGLLLLAGCNAYYNAWSPDDFMKSIPWFDHMITSRAVHPYSRADIPRTTVPGTVPITGGEPVDSAFRSGNPVNADRLINPASPEATLVRGDTLYHTFCAPCHGNAGAADGPVGPKLGALSLLTDKARAYTDGYLYSMVRYGRGVMPRYGDKLYRPLDRWAVVNYVRKLQHDAGAPPPSPAPSAPARDSAPGKAKP
jgi:mono/diheme cytochrome c family protein